MAAVGVGSFDINCTGSLPGSVDCGDPVWTVPDDGVVLVYQLQDWPEGPIAPYPTPVVGPHDQWVEIGGRSALFSQDADGNMSWALLGTPEIIEARFGHAVADTTPQLIQAVIASWLWRSPTATPRPTPITTGSGSATYQWQKVGDAQAGVFPMWSPDSNHLLADMQSANEFDRFALVDRTGDALANFSALTDMFWLNSDLVEGYEANAVPSYTGDDQYHMVPGRAISVADPTPQSVVLPCCYPVSNGHGAVAIKRFLSEKVKDLPRPKFVVWQDGIESAEQDGEPIGWDSAGDKLLVIHPTQPEIHGLSEGWLEVLSWPGLASVFQDDQSIVVDQAEFDPSGSYVSYGYVHPDASGAWQMEIHVIDMASGSTVKIPLAGDSSRMAVGGYVWNDQGQILVVSEVDMEIYTDLPDGTRVSQASIAQSTTLASSTNGATILTTSYPGNGPADLQLMRSGISQPLTLPFDNGEGASLSPDGGQVFANVYPDNPPGVAGYLADIPSP